MSENIKIEKVTVDLAGKKINLSVDETRKLQAALNDIFGNQNQQSNVIVWRELWPYWNYPTNYVSWICDPHTSATKEINVKCESSGELNLNIC